RVGVAADRGERKRVGGRAVEDKVHVAVGVERAPDRVGRGTRPVVGAIPGRVAGVRRFERAPGFRTDTRIVVARELRRVWPPHACGCRRCAAPGGGGIRGSGRPFAAHGPPTLAAVAAALPPVGAGFAPRGGPSPLMVPPRLRLSPLRCPRWGRDSRLGVALRRSWRACGHNRCSTKPRTDCSASGNAAGFEPPACAMSARPPPLPPTCFAT